MEKRATFSAELKENKDAFIDMLRVGTSAGGAKPKAIIALNDETKEVRSGQVKAPAGFGYWLLKFDGLEGGKIKDNPLGIGRIEYSYYQMALDCGIEMQECRLMEEGNKAHFMTKRFDRTDQGDKIMTQTLCALAHYDRDNRHSYEQLFSVIRRLNLSYQETEQLYRRMVFNVVARNHDDHTKNHSFIMDSNGNWSLAPAYDLCYSYSPSGLWTNKHQLSLAGKRDDFTLTDLVKVGEQQGINAPHKIITKIVDVISEWATYATANNVEIAHKNQIHEHLRLQW